MGGEEAKASRQMDVDHILISKICRPDRKDPPWEKKPDSSASSLQSQVAQN